MLDQSISEKVPAHSTSACGGGACERCVQRHKTFCAVLDSGELERLGQVAHRADGEPRQVLFQEGDPARDLFNVMEGTVKLYKSLPDGRTQITGFLFAGDMLGLSADGQYAYSAEAVDHVRLCRLPRREVMSMVNRSSPLAQRLLRKSREDLAAAQDRMLLLGRQTARERIASFLLAMSGAARKRGGDGAHFRLAMSRAEIADYLGLTVETVSRGFTKLRGEGLLKLPSPHDVVLPNPARLAAIVGCDA